MLPAQAAQAVELHIASDAVCSHGFSAMRLETLVIVADPDDVAIGLYESLGFVRGASTWQIERPPAAPRAAP